MKKILAVLTFAFSLLTGLSAADDVLEITLPGSVSFKMIRIEKGTFIMGADDGENEEEEIEHRVTLTQDFYIGETEVTQGQWEAVMKGNPSGFPGKNRPVERVGWTDAMKFCAKLNKMKQAPSGWKFTLPTEAQWEYAAKGGKKSRGYKYSGSNDLNSVGFYSKNAGNMTHDVKSKKPNELGVYDMSGNVWEWCLDRCNISSRDKTLKDGIEDPVGTKGDSCVFRGGSWYYYAKWSRVAARNGLPASQGDNTTGFRLALVKGK